jgi:mRNA interferase MazF
VGRPGLTGEGKVSNDNLGQPVGHDPAFRRPAVVVSVDIVNNGPGGLVVVVPITTVEYRLRRHVELEQESPGLDHTSYARCDQLRVVSVE